MMRQEVTSGNYSDAICNIPPIGAVYDATANDSDKSWTVPGNEQWKLNFAHATLTTTATVGNRLLALRVNDANGNLVFDVTSGALQTASLTRHHQFMQGIFHETAFANGEIQVPIPADFYLLPGYTLRIFDESAIDAAADDMIISVQYMKFKA
jgi:hypothetical protein